MIDTSNKDEVKAFFIALPIVLFPLILVLLWLGGILNLQWIMTLMSLFCIAGTAFAWWCFLTRCENKLTANDPAAFKAGITYIVGSTGITIVQLIGTIYLWIK
jgi:hypothetical protein